jgi:hypothetical protein
MLDRPGRSLRAPRALSVLVVPDPPWGHRSLPDMAAAADPDLAPFGFWPAHSVDSDSDFCRISGFLVPDTCHWLAACIHQTRSTKPGPSVRNLRVRGPRSQSATVTSASSTPHTVPHTDLQSRGTLTERSQLPGPSLGHFKKFNVHALAARFPARVPWALCGLSARARLLMASSRSPASKTGSHGPGCWRRTLMCTMLPWLSGNLNHYDHDDDATE